MGLIGDPAASLVRGQAVRLDGKAIGRVSPGFIAGEDVIFQDRTGLMAVDFRSMFGFLGNLFAGWKRVPKHIGEQGEATGWFRRSMGGYLVINTGAGSLRAKPFFWQVVLSLAVIVGQGLAERVHRQRRPQRRARVRRRRHRPQRPLRQTPARARLSRLAQRADDRGEPPGAGRAPAGGIQARQAAAAANRAGYRSIGQAVP